MLTLGYQHIEHVRYAKDVLYMDKLAYTGRLWRSPARTTWKGYRLSVDTPGYDDDASKPCIFHVNFWRGSRTGVQRRGVLRLENGCCDIDILTMWDARCRVDGQRVQCVEVTYTPSMKSKLCRWIIYDSKGNILVCASSCECPDGGLLVPT